jgi:hypothetical protein
MELERFASEFAHPDVIAACVTLLRDYNRNPVKTNYYCAHLMKRLCALPNDFAGKDPRTLKPLTFIFMMYHVSVIQLASLILNDKSINGRKEFAEMREWAKSFSAQFLRDSMENPMLFVEALFWRSEKSSNADLARHYGLLDGSVAFVSTDGKYNAGLSNTGTGTPKLTKTAAEKHAAEAEARRNALAGSESEEAQLDFEDEDDALRGFQRQPKRNGRRTVVSKKKKLAPRSRSSSSSGSSSSSDSSGSSDSNDSSTSGSSSSKSSASSRHVGLQTTSLQIASTAKVPEEMQTEARPREDLGAKATGVRKLRKGAAFSQSSDSDDSMSGTQASTARQRQLQRKSLVMASDSDDETPQLRPTAGSPTQVKKTEELEKFGDQASRGVSYVGSASAMDDVDAELARDLDPGSLFA